MKVKRITISDLPDPLFRIRPDPNLFFKLRSGWIQISDKNGNIPPDPDPGSESGTSLLETIMTYYDLNSINSIIFLCKGFLQCLRKKFGKIKGII